MGRPRKMRTYRYITFDGFRLVPVDVSEPPYSHKRQQYADCWHVPGQEIMSTRTLVGIAKRRNLSITLSETSREGSKTVSLI